jgi:hypothetical protein
MEIALEDDPDPRKYFDQGKQGGPVKYRQSRVQKTSKRDFVSKRFRPARAQRLPLFFQFL